MAGRGTDVKHTQQTMHTQRLFETQQSQCQLFLHSPCHMVRQHTHTWTHTRHCSVTPPRGLAALTPHPSLSRSTSESISSLPMNEGSVSRRWEWTDFGKGLSVFVRPWPQQTTISTRANYETSEDVPTFHSQFVLSLTKLICDVS